MSFFASSAVAPVAFKYMVDTENTISSEQSSIELLLAHYRFQHGGFITRAGQVPGGVVAFSNLTPVPMWNHAAWCGGEGSFETFLQEAAALQVGQNRRPIIYLETGDPSHARTLGGAGFEKFDEEAWMIFRGKVAGAVLPTGMRFIRAQNSQELQDFTRTFYAAYQVQDGGYASGLRNGHKERGHTHYLLYHGDSAVCIATVVREGALACIYNIGTPPAFRQQGHAGRLMSALLQELTSSGCETVFLQVENQSAAQRLYQKLGFKTLFVRHGFRAREWMPVRQERTQLSSLLGGRGDAEAGQGLTAREAKPIPSELAQRVRLFCDREKITPTDFIALAWACLFHRYSGEEKVAFHFAASDGAPLLPRTMFISRDREVLTCLRNSGSSMESAEVEQVIRFSRERHTSRFDPAAAPIEICICGDIQELEISYRTDLFGKDSIRRLGSHLLTILESILERPESRVSELELLTPQEKHQLLVEWNQSSLRPVEKTIAELFAAEVERLPDAQAMLFARAGVSMPVEGMTYRQLNRKANRLAHFLKSAGVGPEVFVAVCMDRSLDMIVSLLAILKAGGACVPMDPAYPRERIAFMVRDTSAPIVLTQSHLAASLEHDLKARIICLDAQRESVSGHSEKNPVPIARGHDPAYVIYTSGSTGQPKGVVIPNRAIANHCLDCVKHYGLSARDRVLQFSSFNFDASFEQILPALISGATLVVRDNEIWSTREFANKLRDLQLTVVDLPTAYWHELAEQWHADPALIPPHNLRLVIVGGEALAPEKLEKWQATSLNKVRLVNAYGPTETTITATSYTIPPRQNGQPSSGVLPIGRPRADRKAYVLDSSGTPVPIGIPGELHIGGTMLARGYHNRPELTGSRFIPNPFSDDPQSRLYKTGDLVRYLPDGNLEFLGRIDDQVKIRGFRIELGEIETMLRAHPAVREAMVIATNTSGGEKRLAAYVVADPPLPERAELKQYLKQKLPEYMVPSALVVLEKWPLLPSGKIDRRALPEPQEDFQTSAGISGPKDPLELQIQLTFERVLKRAPIGVNVNFFELGGDSLQALELLVEIERATGKSLPLGTLYQSSTVEEIAREVSQRSDAAQWSSLVPLQSGGKQTPLFLLHTTPGDILAYGNLVFRLGADQPCFGFQSLGLKEARFSHHTIEEMTRYYTDLLQEFQPHGPYYLGGWCYGGIIATEMARLLQQRGEKIALLALLETVAMAPGFSNTAYYLHRLRCSLRMSPRRWLRYVREKARYSREARIANRMRFRQVEDRGTMDGEIRDPRLARLEHVYNTNLKALKEYRSTYYDGKVTLFNAVERDPALIPDPQYGWVGLAREIEVHEVPGNHDTMLSEPNVSALASRLNECLVRARQDCSRNQAQYDTGRA